MKYTKGTLTDNEVIKHRGKIHWSIFISPSLIFLIFLLYVVDNGLDEGSSLFFTISLYLLVRSFVIAKTSEFVITSKRIIMKTGFIKRYSVDVLLSKTEAFSVKQGVLGRIFNYGTIIIAGTGGTKSGFKKIANPLEFIRKIQAETEQVQSQTK